MAKKAKEKNGIILESGARFSESIIWKLQSAAYTQYGIGAWGERGVPFYLTSNPFTAKQYAHLTLGYLRDCLRGGSTTPIDLSEPFYIFDLGAGTGRFGFLFLKQINLLLGELHLHKVKVRYVMADFVKGNLEFLKQHPYLQDFIREGMLDFAQYSHDWNGKPLDLMISKETLFTDKIKNPLAVIANYFFDTIPQDLFKVEKGCLQEGRISITAPARFAAEGHSELNPEVIPEMDCTYQYAPLKESAGYYGSREMDSLLEAYAKTFENVPFLFPIGALQSLRYFAELSQNRLLLLAGDQGVCTEEQIKNWGEPKISRHGSFSVSVSYHAIASYFRSLGGTGLLTTYPDPLFVVIAGVLGGGKEMFPETSSAFRVHFDGFEPSDYWKIAACTEEEWQTPSLEYILTLIKLGNWDPMNFHAFFNAVRKQIPDASEGLRERLSETIHNVWGNFYPISPKDAGFALNLGVLFYEMQRYAEALQFFERSLEGDQDSLAALKNIGACYMALHDLEKAYEAFNRAAALEKNPCDKNH